MALFRCTWVGTFSVGEAFTFGHWVQTTGDEDAGDLAEQVGDTYTNSPWNPAQLLALGDNISKMTVYKYATVGAAAIDAAEYPLNESGAAGTDSGCLPSQCAMVYTLRTGAPGASRRGRMYLPFRAASATTPEGLIKPSVQAQMANEFAAYMGSLNVFGVRHGVVVSKTTKEVRNIRSVEVGDVIDTQRRRRTDVSETRHSASISQI